MISSLLWALSILMFCSMTILVLKILKRNEVEICFGSDKFDNLKDNNRLMTIFKDNRCNFQLKLMNKIFFFQKMIDSDMIGLIIFLNSNILTEIIKSKINTTNASPFESLTILIFHSFVSVGSGFLIYSVIEFLKSKRIIGNVPSE